MDPHPQAAALTQAGVWDTLKAFTTVVAPTLAKGVIKRRAIIEGLAQHQGLDEKALRLLQDLRRTYGDGPLRLQIPFRSQVLLLNPNDVAQVLSGTPIPFGSATKEKRSRTSNPGIS